LIIGYEFKPSQDPGVWIVQRLKQLSRRHEHPCRAEKKEAPGQPALASS
jgi:hypothetical protein